MKKQITVHLAQEVFDLVEAFAKKQDRSKMSYCRQAIVQKIARDSNSTEAETHDVRPSSH